MAQRVVCVVGPTASGKTKMGAALAKRFNGEVVSVDSMQIYRGMEIGTAAPTPEEMAGVPHHMIGVADPEGLRDDLLHTIACKSAIKAGMTSDVTELAALVRRVQSGEIRYCPHGRPVAAKLTRYELEKMFKRA